MSNCQQKACVKLLLAENAPILKYNNGIAPLIKVIVCLVRQYRVEILAGESNVRVVGRSESSRSNAKACWVSWSVCQSVNVASQSVSKALLSRNMQRSKVVIFALAC